MHDFNSSSNPTTLILTNSRGNEVSVVESETNCRAISTVVASIVVYRTVFF
ncbi:MAG: hypothetical protein QM751_15995 [Paludibacteraceae bacterium]